MKAEEVTASRGLALLLFCPESESKMIKFIEMLEDVGPVSAFALFWIAVMAVKEGVEIYKWFKSRLEEWRDKKNGIEKKDESVDARIGKLETQMTDLSSKLDTMCDLMMRYQEDNDAVTVANSRATLNTLAEQITAKGYMSEAEYDTFMDLSDIYLRKNGNHTMKDKIIPYIKSLPVKTQ